MSLFNQIEIQTRSEKNGMEFYSNLGTAISAYESDKTIWKISCHCDDDDFEHRWVTKFKSDRWVSEEKINSICEDHNKAQPNDLFWIDQLVYIEDQYRKEKELKEELTRQGFEQKEIDDKVELKFANDRVMNAFSHEKFKKFAEEFDMKLKKKQKSI